MTVQIQRKVSQCQNLPLDDDCDGDTNIWRKVLVTQSYGKLLMTGLCPIASALKLMIM